MQKMYTVKEAAKLMSIDRKMVYKMIEEDKLPAYRLSERNIRIKENDLERWLDKRKI